ncbi:hypothetical protein [Acidovorax sp. Root217]|uniref:hypothetical protein n=1 Tax=Acidovorax sp. Root217 TaxID=1736492 RepID=UPI000708916B|nr:hypothetical protein [Acidovorax sp. Root217]KRC30664.1 hypothetical protein ASE31_00300 [Acidovorax sp. Root217]
MSALSLAEIYRRHVDGDEEERRRHAPKKTRKVLDTATVLSTDSDTLAQARQARAQGRWADAARLFTAAADALPQPHGVACATALTLRRDAHLCLAFVPAFKAHREHNKDARNMHAAEWQRPDGALVHRLVGTRSPA